MNINDDIKYIYLAGPYTTGSNVRNTRRAIDAADLLMEMEYVPFVPHLCLTWDLVVQHNWQYWMDYTAAWLKKCDALVYLTGDSVGVTQEIEMAIKLNMPVFEFERFIRKTNG
jgi:nucleoside 2-deoxyribosyltransferase